MSDVRYQVSGIRYQGSGVDSVTRWPNKLLNGSIRLFGRPKIDRLARVPCVFWAPNINFIALSPDVPFALTVHDLAFERYPEFFSFRRRLWHAAVRPESLCRRAAAILAVSEHTKRDVVELYGVPEERVMVTHLGVPQAASLKPQAEELEAVRKRRRLPERFILQVGTLEPRKNHLATLKAFELLKTLPRFSGLGLVFAGPPGWRNEGLLREIGRSRWRDGIRCLGFVNREDRAALYGQASVFAFPSFYEGFGLPPLEAMASGTPVVASFAASLGEVVGDSGILIDPYRPNELAEALAAVLDSPSLAAELSRRGRERARRFTWDACAEKTAAVFQRLSS
jgi:glycosyltransferase involved in cell wall biosynthesis